MLVNLSIYDYILYNINMLIHICHTWILWGASTGATKFLNHQLANCVFPFCVWTLGINESRKSGIKQTHSKGFHLLKHVDFVKVFPTPTENILKDGGLKILWFLFECHRVYTPYISSFDSLQVLGKGPFSNSTSRRGNGSEPGIGDLSINWSHSKATF